MEEDPTNHGPGNGDVSSSSPQATSSDFPGILEQPSIPNNDSSDKSSLLLRRLSSHDLIYIDFLEGMHSTARSTPTGKAVPLTRTEAKMESSNHARLDPTRSSHTQSRSVESVSSTSSGASGSSRHSVRGSAHPPLRNAFLWSPNQSPGTWQDVIKEESGAYTDVSAIGSFSPWKAQVASQQSLLESCSNHGEADEHEAKLPVSFITIGMQDSSTTTSNHHTEQTNDNECQPLLDKRQTPSAFRDWHSPADDDHVMVPSAWIYLAVISCLSFLLCWGVSLAAGSLYHHSMRLSMVLSTRWFHIAGYEFVFLVVFRTCMALASYLIADMFGEGFSFGSGIPELKCVLSGTWHRKVFSIRTFFSKAISLIFSLASGLSIGRLGPFAHFASIIASFVSQWSYFFPELAQSPKLQIQAISAASAIGVSVTTGCPIGGVLLSVELTGLTFFVHWLPVALYATLMGYAFSVRALDVDEIAYLRTTAQMHLHQVTFVQLLMYSFLGVACGLSGAYFVKVYKACIIKLRSFSFSRWHICLVVVTATLIHSVIGVIIGDLLSMPQKDAVTFIFTQDKEAICSQLSQVAAVARCDKLLWLWYLWLAVAKFALSVMSLILPIPAGIFMPIFFTGGLLGRSFGELGAVLASSQAQTSAWLDTKAFAVIGSAGFSVGVLHTISISIMMLELTGSTLNVLPLGLTCITSYFVSKHLTGDIFSEVIKLKELPIILGLRELSSTELRSTWYQELQSMEAEQVMSRKYPRVHPLSSVAEIHELLQQHWTSCALESDTQKNILYGLIPRAVLIDAVIHSPRVRLDYSWKEEPATCSGSSTRSRTRSNDPDSFLGLQFLKQFNTTLENRALILSALIEVDPSPFQVGLTCPLWRLKAYFQILGVGGVYVVQEGAICGYISKARLIAFIHEYRNRSRHS